MKIGNKFEIDFFELAIIGMIIIGVIGIIYGQK